MHSHLVHPSPGRSWWLLLLLGVIAVLFGLLAMLDPVRAGTGITWAIGWVAAAEGISTLVAMFRKDVPFSKAWMLFYTVISLAFGAMAILNPVAMAASFMMVMAFWAIVAGMTRIIFALRMRTVLDQPWLLVLSGVLALVLGGLTLSMPFAGLMLAVTWIGVGALVYGALQIFAALRIRKYRCAGMVTTPAEVKPA